MGQRHGVYVSCPEPREGGKRGFGWEVRKM